MFKSCLCLICYKALNREEFCFHKGKIEVGVVLESKRYDALTKVIEAARRIDPQLPKVKPNKQGQYGTISLSVTAPIYDSVMELKQALSELEGRKKKNINSRHKKKVRKNRRGVGLKK